MATLIELAPVADEMQQVDVLVRQRLGSDVPLVRQVAEYIVAGGGKRLRPALLLLSAGAAGYRGGTHLELATVIEFIHTATLLHDDVVDESRLRRGRETANAAFGNAASVLVGDFLYSRAFQMMVSVDNMRVMQVLADATNTIAEGEVLQLMNCHDPDVDEQRYLEVIRRKTAKLFEAAARLGGVLAGVAPELEEGLASYGTARRHRVPAGRRRAGLFGRRGRHRQEPRRRPGRGQADAAADPCHALRHADAIGAGAKRDRGRRARALSRRAGGDQSERRAGLRPQRRRARSRAGARHAIEPLPHSKYKDSLLELSAFSVTRRS